MKLAKWGIGAGALIITSMAALTTQALAADANIAAAVAAPDRPERDTKLDESRKPAQTLEFLGLKPGDQVLDVMAGGGYYTRIMAQIVGDKGKVVAMDAPSFVTSEQALRSWADLITRPDNIELSLQFYSNFKAADNSYDFALLHLVYHDAYWESEQYSFPRAEPAEYLAGLFRAMKPGGTVGVIDHVGPAGDPRQVVEAMHRIDPETVKADFAKAGFILEAEGDFLSDPADDHSKNVFDPSIRGKTDRFVMKFRKPA